MTICFTNMADQIEKLQLCIFKKKNSYKKYCRTTDILLQNRQEEDALFFLLLLNKREKLKM